MASLLSWPVAAASRLGRAASDPGRMARTLRQLASPERFLDELLDHPTPAPLVLHRSASGTPALNILLPRIAQDAVTGGPNTALAIGRLASDAGMRVRLVGCDQPPSPRLDWLAPHLAAITGRPPSPDAVEVADATHGLACGERDLFLATFWTTAARIGAALGAAADGRLLYLIQDYEPGFYAWSSRYAQALATYDLPFRAIVNEHLLAEHFRRTGTGRFADPAFASGCTVFEPAVPRVLFADARAAAPVAPAARSHRLLLYLRPTNPRNLTGMAVAALRRAAAGPALRGWEFLGIGGRGSMPPIPLADGRVLRQVPWGSYRAHAALLGASDVLLAPMLSPHTGYPVLEMAATGGVAITNSFGVKTPEALRAISPLIIGVPPTEAAFADALIAAATAINDGARGAPALDLPEDWDTALAAVLAAIRSMLPA